MSPSYKPLLNIYNQHLLKLVSNSRAVNNISDKYLLSLLLLLLLSPLLLSLLLIIIIMITSCSSGSVEYFYERCNIHYYLEFANEKSKT